MDICEKEKQLKSYFLEQHSYIYLPLNEEEINQVYNLFFNNIEEEVISSNSTHYYGLHYHLKNNHEKTIKYYLKSIEKKNSHSMNNLAVFYKEQKDYESMEKYFLMAIENDNGASMTNLGIYYKELKDYDNMMKYYHMAIDKGNYNGIWHLGIYYKEQKDYDNMMNYYLMHVKGKNVNNKINYSDIVIKSTGIDMTGQAYVDIDEPVFDSIIKKLVEFDDHNIKKDNEIDILKNKIVELQKYIVELECLPNGIEYKKAKEHFELMVNQ